MKEDAIRTAPGGVARDDHARLRIDHGHGIAVELGGVEEAPVGRERNVADEILRGTAGCGDRGKGAAGRQGSVIERELKHGALRSATDIDAVAVGSEGDSQPSVGNRRGPEDARGGGIDDGDGGRLVSAVQDQQILAVARKRGGHGKGVEGDLTARRLETPAAVEQKAAIGQGSDAFPRRGLGTEQGRRGNGRGGQRDAGDSGTEGESHEISIVPARVRARAAGRIGFVWRRRKVVSFEWFGGEMGSFGAKKNAGAPRGPPAGVAGPTNPVGTPGHSTGTRPTGTDWVRSVFRFARF